MLLQHSISGSEAHNSRKSEVRPAFLIVMQSDGRVYMPSGITAAGR
jgi:hypothetical protein